MTGLSLHRAGNGAHGDTRAFHRCAVSLQAKGLYALMFSRPADWIFYEAALVASSKEGRDAVRAAMRELLQFKWMSKQQPRSDGKFSGNVYRLHVTADWESGDGSSDDGEPALSSKTEKNKTDTLCVRFDDYWSLVPNKLDRKGCERIWKRDRLDAVADEVIAGLKRWKAFEQWQNARYIPHPSTRLDLERWKSEPPPTEKCEG